jgi:hypothetical protein
MRGQYGDIAGEDEIPVCNAYKQEYSLMNTIFLDTNIFIQCRDLHVLPWKEITGDESLTLVVSRSVQKQIDSFKQGGNTRRAKHARKANSLFRKVLCAPDHTLVISEKPIEVSLCLKSHIYRGGELPCDLELTGPDDAIIADAIAYARLHPEDNISILTHDTGPLLTAKTCGVPYHIIPEDWLLPPESDPRDKEIFHLKERLGELEKQIPIISVQTLSDTGLIDKIDVSKSIYPILSEGQISDLAANILRRFPMKVNFEDQANPDDKPHVSIIEPLLEYKCKFIQASKKEIDDYQKIQYPSWIKDLRKYFYNLAERCEYPEYFVAFSMRVTNEGQIPADNLIVEFELSRGLLLLPPNEECKDNLFKIPVADLPVEPKAPHGRWEERFRGMQNAFEIDKTFAHIAAQNRSFGHLLSPPPLAQNFRKDRNAFYWKPGRPDMPADRWCLECEEFRHKADPKIFNIIIEIEDFPNVVKGCLKARITAKNLPQPFEHTLPIEIAYVKKDTMLIAEEILCRYLNAESP